MATHGKFILYKKNDPPPRAGAARAATHPHRRWPMSGVESLTAKMVAKVRAAKSGEEQSPLYERIFAEINDLTLVAKDAVEAYKLEELGQADERFARAC